MIKCIVCPGIEHSYWVTCNEHGILARRTSGLHRMWLDMPGADLIGENGLTWCAVELGYSAQSVTQNLVRHAESQAPPWTYSIRFCILTRFQMIPHMEAWEALIELT